jgi:Tat protein secretion system quality control protein TatD with DNase activity
MRVGQPRQKCLFHWSTLKCSHLFDSHCHLTDMPEPENVISQASSVGVTSVLCCGYNAISNAAVAALRDRVGNLPIAVGLHPWYVNEPT